MLKVMWPGYLCRCRVQYIDADVLQQSTPDAEDLASLELCHGGIKASLVVAVEVNVLLQTCGERRELWLSRFMNAFI